MTDETAGQGESGRVVVTRELNVAPEGAFRAWSDPEQVRQWWGPTGFTCPRADIDFRVGGSTLVTMRAPAEFGGMEWTNRWTYTRIDEPSRIEFVSAFADADGNVIDRASAGIPGGVPQGVPHVVEFEAITGNRTRVTVTEYGYGNEDARRQSEAGQEQVMDKMQALFA